MRAAVPQPLPSVLAICQEHGWRLRVRNYRYSGAELAIVATPSVGPARELERVVGNDKEQAALKLHGLLKAKPGRR